MGRQTFLIIPLLATLPSINAVTYLQRSQYCVAACSVALNHVSFDGNRPASASHSSPVPCTDKHYIQSLFYCTSTYCTPDEVQSGLDYNNETCLVDAGKSLPSYAAFMDAPSAAPPKTIMRISEADVRQQKFTQPIVPDQDFYNVGHKSVVSTAHPCGPPLSNPEQVAQNRATYYNWNFAWALYGYWGLVVLIGMGNRAIQHLRHRRSQPRLDLIKGESFGRQSSSPIARAGVWIRRHMLLPLTFANHREAPFTIPTRLEGLLIALYVVMNFVFCLPGYHTFKGNL